MAYLVQSLVNLRSEIDSRWPSRDRRTDGWYADPKVRTSYGHNPDGKGAVHAIDVDKDGIDPDWIINNIYRAGFHLWYIIWNRGIWDTQHGWKREAYHGANPHTDHLHIEVFHDAAGENYNGSWSIAVNGAQTFGVNPYPDGGWGDADPSVPMALFSGHVIDGGTAGFNAGKAIASLRNL